MNIGVHGSFWTHESYLILNEAFILKEQGSNILLFNSPPGPWRHQSHPLIVVLAPMWLVTDPTSSYVPLLPLLFRQGQELTIRQISLLGFRDLVLLKVKLEDLLLLAQPQLPSSIVQMLLILQVRRDGDITEGWGKGPLWLEHPGSVCLL